MRTRELIARLCVADADAAIAFYVRAFGATETYRLQASGRIGNAEIDLDGHRLMLAEEFPEFDFHAPGDGPGTSFAIHLKVDDADAVVARAVEAGAVLLKEVSDQFYGQRSGTIRDPFGHRWSIGHDVEDVSPEELQRRYAEMMKSRA